MEKKPTKPLLNEFLGTFEQIPNDLRTDLLKFSNDEDEKNIVNSMIPILNEQFKELASQVREANGKATLQQQQESENFLRISSGMTVAKNLKLALPSIGSLVGKFGIGQIIITIKKIITKLFPNLPKWLDAILEIIDEIVNALLGGSSIETKNKLSRAEQNFLEETRLLVLLENGRENKRSSGEEEES